jgi:hypothetical protein
MAVAITTRPYRTTERYPKLYAAVYAIAVALLFNMVPPVGATANPNIQKDYDVIPSMGKLIWNGIPNPEFIRKFFNPLMNGLGSISENGSTMLATALGNDAAGIGPRAMPHWNLASAQQRDQSRNRNYRLHSLIMNYIAPLCYIYGFIQMYFRNDGMAVFRYIRNWGNIAYTTHQLFKFENQWQEFTLRNLRIEINEKSLFLLAEQVHEQGTRIGKTPAMMKQKFLESLPQELQHVRISENKNVAHVGYVFPAVYPIYFPAHMAGLVHPNAGMPDVMAMARYINHEWIYAIEHGLVKGIPKGLVAQIHDDALVDVNDPELCLAITEEVSAVPMSKLTADMDCNLCGGKGHATVNRDDSGTIITCASHALGTITIQKGNRNAPNDRNLKKVNAILKDTAAKYKKYKTKWVNRDTKPVAKTRFAASAVSDGDDSDGDTSNGSVTSGVSNVGDATSDSEDEMDMFSGEANRIASSAGYSGHHSGHRKRR